MSKIKEFIKDKLPSIKLSFTLLVISLFDFLLWNAVYTFIIKLKESVSAGKVILSLIGFYSTLSASLILIIILVTFIYFINLDGWNLVAKEMFGNKDKGKDNE